MKTKVKIMQNLQEKLRAVTSLVDDDRVIMYKGTNGRPGYIHANPEFEGTGRNGDFFYKPWFLSIDNMKEYIDDEEEFFEFMQAIKTWKEIARDYYQGKIDLNFLGQDKTAAIFILNFFLK